MLERLLAVEVETTQARRLASRLRFACLPTQSRLDEFDFTHAQPGVDEKLIRGLTSLLPRRRRQRGVCRPTRHRQDDAGHRARPAPSPKLVIASTSPPPTIWLNAVTRPRWKAVGPPACDCLCGPRLLVIDESPTPEEILTPEANTALFEVISRRFSNHRRSSPHIPASPAGASASATPCSPPRF